MTPEVIHSEMYKRAYKDYRAEKAKNAKKAAKYAWIFMI